MNWQHLKYFTEAAKQQNFRIAADNLFIDTSTLSKAIANIENELGLPLFLKKWKKC